MSDRPYAEYLRRNLVVCGAIGARAGCDTALERLRGQKGAPKWLIEQLESIRDRVVPTIDELAAWRATAADAPIAEWRSDISYSYANRSW